MGDRWIYEVESITICIGISIAFLGVFYITQDAIVPHGLIIGVSLSGFCFATIDVINELNKGKQISRMLSIIIYAFYMLAAMGIIYIPNLKFILNLGETKLNLISTGLSVSALGLVFMLVGVKNKMATINEKKKQDMNILKIEMLERRIMELENKQNNND
ncbi:hypothetical protein BAQ47_25685 [Bacillus tropicus]|uniref:hypothetical protein n=1 Tax=Bacillus tropicus TaxID=2026188 RepID=UPI0008FE2660|nr:hypothetical protein [Bacillus tropicus]OJE33019.1 hypothetical protein BAQ47_25685 [Bacillus tropicus]